MTGSGGEEAGWAQRSGTCKHMMPEEDEPGTGGQTCWAPVFATDGSSIFLLGHNTTQHEHMGSDYCRCFTT